MNNFFKTLGVIVLVALIGFSVTACPPPGDPGDPPTVETVTVTPKTTTMVERGNSIEFTATVTGTNDPAQTVTWSVEGDGKNVGTTIDGAGKLTVALAETLSKLTVKATSTVDTSKSGTIEVNVYAPGKLIVNSVTVSPSATSVTKGESQNFTATVAGPNTPPQDVTWKIVETGKHASTSISSAGVLTVASAESLATLTVEATSEADKTKKGTATVTITAPVLTPTVISVTVNVVTSTAVVKGGTLEFTATVEGTNNPAQSVTWSIEENGKHADTSISSAGVLTVASAETLQTLTIRATSTVNNTKYGTIEVNVYGDVGSIPTVTTFEIDEDSSTLVQKGGFGWFYVTVNGDNDSSGQNATWSIVESGKNAATVIIKTENGNGLLYVAADETLNSLTIKATSTVDPSKHATTTVTLTAPVGKVLTITGIDSSLSGEMFVGLYDMMNDFANIIAYGRGIVANGTLKVALYTGPGTSIAWTESGDCFVGLTDSMDEDTANAYLYTNGEDLPANPFDATIKYNFTTANPTIAFNLFKKVLIP